MALQGLDLTIEKGEVTAIIGNSGSGKSTLLNILGGLVKPSAGKVHIDGEDLLLFNEKKLDEFKLNTVVITSYSIHYTKLYEQWSI